MEFIDGPYRAILMDEPCWSARSVDNAHVFDRVYDFSNRGYKPTSQYGLHCHDATGSETSCLLLACGGVSGIHEHSVVLFDHRCIVAIGDTVCCLSLPRLEKEWATVVDPVTCFGIYMMPSREGLISHGELAIARVSFSGEIVWSASGRDIFSGRFRVDHDGVKAIDFGGDAYRFNIDTGGCEEIQKVI